MIIGILIGAYAIIALFFLYIEFSSEERFTPLEFLGNIVSVVFWPVVLFFGLISALIIGIKTMLKE